MTGRLVLLAGSLVLTACVTVEAPDKAAEPAQRDAFAASCTAGPAQDYVGRKATQEAGAAIQSATRARVFQWVGPGMAVTMDYRGDRVRVAYDAAMAITSIRCG